MCLQGKEGEKGSLKSAFNVSFSVLRTPTLRNSEIGGASIFQGKFFASAASFCFEISLQNPSG